MANTRYVTVSAKIPSQVRQKMRRLGIRPSQVFKRGLAEALKTEQAMVLSREAKKVSKILQKISIEDVVKGIREDRDSR
jgi:hypothetical protein